MNTATVDNVAAFSKVLEDRSDDIDRLVALAEQRYGRPPETVLAAIERAGLVSATAA